MADNSLRKPSIIIPNKTLLAMAISLACGNVSAQQEQHTQWGCLADDSGGWNCREEAAPGPAYKRPLRSSGPINNNRGPKDSADSKTVYSHHRLDWVDEAQLSEAQRQQLSPGCCGAFIAPERTDAEAKLNPEQSPVRISADDGEAMQQTSSSVSGEVKIIQGYRQVEADSALVDQGANRAELDGNIRLREPGILVTGDTMDINMDTGAATITEAEYVLHLMGIHGQASRIDRNEDETLVMHDASYTQCEPEDPSWDIRGSKISIDPETEVGTARNLTLNIKGIPVFYTPYLRFPVGDKRQSGFLFPSISSSDNGGLDIATPYYFNLAPNYDATVTPRYISDRGFMLETELRHLNSYFDTVATFAFLSDDKGGGDTDLQRFVDLGLISENDASPYEGEDRWLASLAQSGGSGQRWYSNIDYSEVSDVDYFRDLDTASLSVNSETTLNQTAALGYRFNNWNVSATAQQYQSLIRNGGNQYKQLPKIKADGHYRWGDIELELNHEYTVFKHQDADINTNIITGDRARLDYRLSWDKQWLWGFAKPTVGYRALAYKLDSENLLLGANNSPDAGAAFASFDSGAYFERSGSLFGRSYSQTFEPRLFYLYSEYADQSDFFNLTAGGSDIKFDTAGLTFSYSQLFRDTRFSGSDRIDDANQLSVGLTTRFINDRSGLEWLRLSLGQIFYFDDRYVSVNGQYNKSSLTDTNTIDTMVQLWQQDLQSSNLNTRINAQRQLDQLGLQIDDDSEFALEITGQLAKRVRYGSNLVIKNDGSQIESGDIYLRYFDDQARILNLSYRYNRMYSSVLTETVNGNTVQSLVDNDQEQAEASIMWPVYNNWSVIAKTNYDIGRNRELETIAGLEYNSCCYRIRLLGRRWLDNDVAGLSNISFDDLQMDKGIFFEIQLKGLGGIGGKLSGILEEGIIGYKQREEFYGIKSK